MSTFEGSLKSLAEIGIPFIFITYFNEKLLTIKDTVDCDNQPLLIISGFY